MLALSFMFACPSVAQRSYIDKRVRTEKQQHVITFAASKGNPGHAFVIWSKENKKKRMTVHTALGLYPNLPKKRLYKVLFGGVGKLASDAKRKAVHSLTILVNSDQYQKALRVHQRWKQSKKYTLYFRDCVTYVDAIAKSINLKTPKRASNPFPLQYLQSLIRQNSKELGK